MKADEKRRFSLVYDIANLINLGATQNDGERDAVALLEAHDAKVAEAARQDEHDIWKKEMENAAHLICSRCEKIVCKHMVVKGRVKCP